MYITNNIFISRKIRKNRTITYYIAMHRVSTYNRKKTTKIFVNKTQKQLLKAIQIQKNPEILLEN